MPVQRSSLNQSNHEQSFGRSSRRQFLLPVNYQSEWSPIQGLGIVSVEKVVKFQEFQGGWWFEFKRRWFPLAKFQWWFPTRRFSFLFFRGKNAVNVRLVCFHSQARGTRPVWASRLLQNSSAHTPRLTCTRGEGRKSVIHDRVVTESPRNHWRHGPIICYLNSEGPCTTILENEWRSIRKCWNIW